MTPKQFRLAVEGRRRANEGLLEMMAWQAAQIINHRTPAFGEKKRKLISVDDLLGRKKKQRRTFKTKAELERYMREVAQRHEAELNH